MTSDFIGLDVAYAKRHRHFYDSTWWRYAKGLPPRDKCCRPFRSQLRIPIESLSRKTDKSEVIWADKSEWIGAWIIFDFEILVAAVLRRIRLLRKPDRFCCPFIRTVIDAIRLIDTVTVSIPTAANLSLCMGGFHSLDAVQKGTLKWESSLELSSYRSVVGQFGSSNCAMNTTYRPGEFLRRNDVTQHTVTLSTRAFLFPCKRFGSTNCHELVCGISYLETQFQFGKRSPWT